MALTKDVALSRRGPPARSGSFGYPVAPNEIIYRGGLIGINATFQAQRLQTAGTVAFIGVADNQVNNLGNAAATPTGQYVTAERGTYQLAVPGAVAANIGALVYATDDNTLTLASGTAGAVQIGTLVGFENGLTYVQITGG